MLEDPTLPEYEMFFQCRRVIQDIPVTDRYIIANQVGSIQRRTFCRLALPRLASPRSTSLAPHPPTRIRTGAVVIEGEGGDPSAPPRTHHLLP